MREKDVKQATDMTEAWLEMAINERDSQFRDTIIDVCRRHGCKELGDEILTEMGLVEA